VSESTTGGAAALRITLVRSTIGRPKDQEATVRALGLRRMHQTVERADTASIRGMVTKVRHLVRVDEVPAGEAALPSSKQPRRG